MWLTAGYHREQVPIQNHAKQNAALPCRPFVRNMEMHLDD